MNSALCLIHCDQLESGGWPQAFHSERPHELSFRDGRCWPETDPSQLVQLIGVIVDGIV